MKTTEKLLAAAIMAVNSAPEHLQIIWANRQLLAGRVAVDTAEILALTSCPVGDSRPLNFMAGNPYMELTFRAPCIQRHSDLAAAFSILDASPIFAEADKILGPLVSEVHRLEAILADLQEQHGIRAAALADAEAQATAAALAKAAAAPAVLAARAALEELQGHPIA